MGEEGRWPRTGQPRPGSQRRLRHQPGPLLNVSPETDTDLARANTWQAFDKAAGDRDQGFKSIAEVGLIWREAADTVILKNLGPRHREEMSAFSGHLLL